MRMVEGEEAKKGGVRVRVLILGTGREWVLLR